MVALFLYLTWTPLYYNYIDGFSGRYLIPIALLPMIAISAKLFSRYSLQIQTALVTPFLILSLSITSYTIYKRYYVLEPTSYQIETVFVNQTKDTLVAKGWVISKDTSGFNQFYRVDIDGTLYTAQFGRHRSEIAAKYHVPLQEISEFELKVPLVSLKPGKHLMSVYLLDSSGKGHMLSDGDPMKFNFDH